MSLLTIAVCSYNRANRLSPLINALRSQECPVPFEIIVVDNNSTDNTQQVIRKLANSGDVPLRYVKETRQGIVHARNCAIEISRESTFLAFIDDDELPGPTWIKAAVDALDREGAECVGGEIRVKFVANKKPVWLTDELLGFLGENSYGNEPFWIVDHSRPVWSGNIAYRTSVFRNGLKFDSRYNREGEGIGGGEDAIMFELLLKRGVKIRYRPDMIVEHFVEAWKLKRRYFIKLHFIAGMKFGRYATGEYEHTIMGVPLFLFRQFPRQWGRSFMKLLRHEPGMLRQAMNGAHSTGMVIGRIQRWKDRNIKMLGDPS
jgi:glycosyltransferase involved in cell wall biosynthesis